MAKLTLENMTKKYDDAQGVETAVDDLSLSIDDELLVLLGPSGCGKTTTLRTIAGLESVTDGHITIGNKDVTSFHPSQRSIAMAFQDYGLYTSMTVHENMDYGLKHSTDMSKTERNQRVEEMAETLDISRLLSRNIAELSGGQKQRVALGRAIVREPDVFLLDEPLASLDAKLRSEMRTEIQELQRNLDIATVYVTHDQKEAMTMADRIAIMNNGMLRQIGSPEEVYRDPVDQFVADFLGNPSMNFLQSRVRSEENNLAFYHKDMLVTQLPTSSNPQLSDGDRVVIGLRPENIRLNGGDDAVTFPIEVGVSEYQGNDNFLHAMIGDDELTIVTPPESRPARGQTITVSVDPSNVYIFDAETGKSLKTAAN